MTPVTNSPHILQELICNPKVIIGGTTGWITAGAAYFTHREIMKRVCCSYSQKVAASCLSLNVQAPSVTASICDTISSTPESIRNWEYLLTAEACVTLISAGIGVWGLVSVVRERKRRAEMAAASAATRGETERLLSSGL